MLYKNLNHRKVKGSHLLLISCGNCKSEIAKYQKLGKGNVLRMYKDRIIESNVELKGDLICPNCNNKMAVKALLKKENKEFYKMKRSKFNTREINN